MPFHGKIITLTLATIIIFSCSQQQEKQLASANLENPASEGFDLENSDQKAIEIADQVMQAMGGRKAWDNTKYISWNFFGVRKLFWDRDNQTVRIEVPKDTVIIILDMKYGEGRASKKFEEISNADSLKPMLDFAEKAWINDSYWLVMPFKLKDSGVTLHYLGDTVLNEEQHSGMLQLTFKDVGVTPENKYVVYVDRKTNLVSQWDFYRSSNLDSPNFSTPWLDYKEFGNIKLSGNRGQRQLSEIVVQDSLDHRLFTDLEELLL